MSGISSEWTTSEEFVAGALLQIGLQPDPQLGPHGVTLQPGHLGGGEGDADGQGQAGHPRPRQGGEVQGGGRGPQPQAEGGHGEPGAEAERGGGQHQTSHLSQVPEWGEKCMKECEWNSKKNTWKNGKKKCFENGWNKTATADPDGSKPAEESVSLPGPVVHAVDCDDAGQLEDEEEGGTQQGQVQVHLQQQGQPRPRGEHQGQQQAHAAHTTCPAEVSTNTREVSQCPEMDIKWFKILC